MSGPVLLTRAHRWRNGLPVFLTTAERDLNIPAPLQGEACYVDSNDIAEGLQTYSGTAWRPTSWNISWGRMPAGGTSTATTVGITTDTDLITATWTVVAGRRYRLMASAIMNQVTTAGVQFLKLTDNVPNQINVCQRNVAAGNTETLFTFAEVTPGAGVVTYRSRVSCNAGSITLAGGAAQPHYLVVDDVGPSAAPS